MKEPEVAASISELQGRLASGLDDLAQRMVDSITEADIQGINAYQRTIAAAATTDKMRLLREQSTSNTSILLQAVMESFGEPGSQED